jgi:hypothetical protein
MYEEVNDWTHKEVSITDIRKVNDFYIFTISFNPGRSFEDPNYQKAIEVSNPLSVKSNIFEDRLKPYFLKEAHQVSREEILSVKWNMYIKKGYYIKLHKGKAYPHQVDPSKHYISYLEIAGPLGGFQSITSKEKDHNE